MADPINNYADTIDSREVIERIQELEEQRDNHAEDPETYDELTEDEAKELAELTELAKAAEGYAPDWRYGETLIRDSYFQDYARDTAHELNGEQFSEAKWPFTCIDWEEAANELQTDYTSVEFGDVTYWIR